VSIFSVYEIVLHVLLTKKKQIQSSNYKQKNPKAVYIAVLNIK